MESKPEPVDMAWSLPGAEDSLGSVAGTSASVLQEAAAGAGVGCPLLLGSSRHLWHPGHGDSTSSVTDLLKQSSFHI